MWRVVFYFLLIAVFAGGFVWLAERPGEVTINWFDYEIETSLMVAAGFLVVVVGVLWTLWSTIAGVLGLPGFIGGFFRLRRKRLGYEALSKGMLAAGAGDAPVAQKFANQAGRWLAGEPLTLMLKAQAAQLRGDDVAAERIFRSMMQTPETELLGFHGLFILAQRSGDGLAAKKFAELAFSRNPGLPWATRAVLVLQSASGNWQAAEQTLAQARGSKLITKAESARKQAVLLCARAMEQEENDDESALQFALQSHKLAPALVPCAVIAGRILAARGQATRAARVLAKTWRLSPHPDLAEIYAAARQGDAPRERLKRLRLLIKKAPGGDEGAIALARAGVEARDWRAARGALAPLLTGHLSARICALMAEIEQGEFGDRGKVREWLARAVHAPRDPVWTADGYVSQNWLPISPVTGELDQFEWKVPLEAVEGSSHDMLNGAVGNGAALESFVQGEETEKVDDAAENVPASPKPEGLDSDVDAKADMAAPAGPGIEGDENLDVGEVVPIEPALSKSASVADKTAVPDETKETEESSAKDLPDFFVPRPPDDPGPRTPGQNVGSWLRSIWPR